MASPLTVWSSTADGRILSTHATYSNAAAGSSLVVSSDQTANSSVGQTLGFNVYEGFASFDTSSIGAGSTVTLVTMSIRILANEVSTQTFTLTCRIHDWGAVLETGDWVAPANMSAKTLVATKLITSGLTGYIDLTSETAFLTNIAKSGTTYVFWHSDRHESQSQPSVTERLQTYWAEDATGGGGTDRDPKLYVEYTEDEEEEEFTGLTVTSLLGG